ncbi:MAG: hypothetical protein U0931_03770 [Vulcanimicrobiota bacterium]
MLAFLVSALLCMLLTNGLIVYIRAFWRRLEPPQVAPARPGPEIGPSVVGPGRGRGLQALGLMLLMPLLIALKDIQLACWAVVGCCLLGYPLYCWGDWLGKRFGKDPELSD